MTEQNNEGGFHFVGQDSGSFFHDFLAVQSELNAVYRDISAKIMENQNDPIRVKVLQSLLDDVKTAMYTLDPDDE